ncbi:CoA transferase [Paraburkholderia caballeronis]|uniref:CoA-transferase family III n=1 Tax=Paraburkholderia caballeronis TaxID=416943 RepID=A0A1H7PL06_9BURK|nr:CoA transferase [Paraburkholderia caballeronis]PXW24227.1 CoA transferase family III [Paraburkholderia caballeronis]PXX00009.1 CoA transferase family III [Paraburkholderia caballeronis]RAJ97138.1 CoA transferase family III [Paraburkholderia caballeronis]SEB73077.1 CoA-transferase family III [Paraburkholderia caballeronis]SEL36452.1 CoA-transferase family III [Paraburkholderia caballeronis]
MTPRGALEHLWMLADCNPAALDDLHVAGDDPGLPSIYRVGTLAAATIGAAGLAAAECFRVRTGRRQRVDIDVRRALAAFRSERYLRVGGDAPIELRHPVTGFFATRDDRWIQLHANFPHHLKGIVDVLGCADDPASVAAAIREWDGAALDDALAAAGLCAALVRSPREWAALDQARAVASLPLFEIERIGDAPPEPIASITSITTRDAARPLDGVRVLDLTRIIAGPVAGRTLAHHGADVLLVNGPHLPNIAPLVIDNGRGKRSATLDLRDAAACEQLRSLARDADVFLQAYRPGALASRGFAPEQLARLRPGIVCVSVCAYGHRGPWAGRRGFDSLVQSASGIVWNESSAASPARDGRPFGAPRHLPCQALDHGTGYLAAFGAMVALARRAQEGGSWHVRVSLAQTGRWLQTMGQIEDGWRAPDVGLTDVADCIEQTASPFGTVRAIGPAERLSLTPAFYARPPVPVGTDAARWDA